MIPGPFALVRVITEESSDALRYEDIAWGYDTLEQATEAMRQAIGAGTDPHEVAVIRVWFGHDLNDVGGAP